MDIVSIAHKGLREFVESDDTKGLNQNHVSRLRNILAALIAAPDMDAVHCPPSMARRVGEFTSLEVTARACGRYPSPAIGV